MVVSGPAPPVDVSMLAGLAYACRPACGLCCFATPRARPEERRRLLEVQPTVPFLAGEGGAVHVADRGDGGACWLLAEQRCRAHAARPVPCREFPLSVHIGERVQVSAVLSCPGVDLAGLSEWAQGGPPVRAPAGFALELEAVRDALGPDHGRTWSDQSVRRMRTVQRRLERGELWEEPEAIRAAVGPELPDLVREAFPADDPPEAEDGIAGLPLFFDEVLGRVAIARHPGGWEFLALSEDGRSPRSLGVLPPPERCPELTDDGQRALRGYLGYLLARDLTYWQAAARVRPDGGAGLLEEVAWDVSDFGALALARGQLRRELRGAGSGPLDAAAVLDGIRATDAEFVDRPTLGLLR
jgi:Fe-S-cluster containining protein